MRRLTDLYDYQQKAYEKIRKSKVGALFVEMGLGKTRIAIEILNNKIENNKINKILYLCPLSIKQNIIEQFNIHCLDMLNICKICGIETISMSDNAYLDCLKYIDDKTAIVVDESTLIKNFYSKRSKRIIKMRRIL